MSATVWWAGAVLLLLGLPGAESYVLMPSNVSHRSDKANGDVSRLASYAYRWSYPAESSSLQGLGGGLAFVMAPDFCDKILPSFREDSLIASFGLRRWVSCTDLLDAFQRGFDTWSDNSRAISFTDVSGSTQCASPTAQLDDPCPWELFIDTADGTEHPSLSAYVNNHRASKWVGHSGGYYYDTYYSNWQLVPTRSPSGATVTGADPYRRSTMTFNTHLCWYLDATFCYAFQRWAANGIDVALIGVHQHRWPRVHIRHTPW